MASKPCVYSTIDGISLASGKKLVAVHLLTSEILYVAVEKQCKVNELFNQLCRQLNLIECIELFGLCMRQDQCRWYSGIGSSISSGPTPAASGRSYNASQVEAAMEAGEAELAAQSIFLDPCAKLSKYACKQWKHAKAGLDALGRPYLQLQLRVQFYVDSYLFLVDRIARLHYYLQLKRNILEYSLASLTTERAFLLASIALQADKGDRANQRQTSSLTDNPNAVINISGEHFVEVYGYFEPSEYLPGWLLAEMGHEYVLRHLPSMHQDQVGLSAAEAQLMFIKEASEQSAHNLHMYRLFRHSHHHPTSSSHNMSDRIWLGVCPSGVLLFEQDRSAPRGFCLRSRLSTFAWPDIGKLFFDKRKFEIRSIGNPIRKFTYFTCSEEMAKHLLWLCRVSHQFQLMIAPRLREMKRREQELSRKKYRESYIYSGDDNQAGKLTENKNRRAISSCSTTVGRPNNSSDHARLMPNTLYTVNTLSTPNMEVSLSHPTVPTSRPESMSSTMTSSVISGNSSRESDRSSPMVVNQVSSQQHQQQQQRVVHTAEAECPLNTVRLSLESLTMSGLSEPSTSSGLSERPFSSSASNPNHQVANNCGSAASNARSSQLSCRSASNGSCSSDSAFISCEQDVRVKRTPPLQSINLDIKQCHPNTNTTTNASTQPKSFSFGKLELNELKSETSLIDRPKMEVDSQVFSKTNVNSSLVSFDLPPCSAKHSNDYKSSLRPSESVAALHPSGRSAQTSAPRFGKSYELPTFASLSNFSSTKPAVESSKVSNSNARRFGRLASASKSMPNVAGDLFDDGDMNITGGAVLHRTRGAMTLHQTSPAIGSIQSVRSNRSEQSVFSSDTNQTVESLDTVLSHHHQVDKSNPLPVNSAMCNNVNMRSDSDSSSQGRMDMATSPLRQHIYENVPFHRPPIVQSLTPARVGPKIGVSSLTRGMQLANSPAYQMINGMATPLKAYNPLSVNSSALTSGLIASVNCRPNSIQSQQPTSNSGTAMFHSEPNLPNPIDCESTVVYKATRALSDPTALGLNNSIQPAAVLTAKPPSQSSAGNHLMHHSSESHNSANDFGSQRLRNVQSIENLTSDQPRILPKRSPSSTTADFRMNANRLRSEPSNQAFIVDENIPKPAKAWARSALHQSLCDLARPTLRVHNSAFNLSQLPCRSQQRLSYLGPRAESSNSLLGSSHSSGSQTNDGSTHQRINEQHFGPLSTHLLLLQQSAPSSSSHFLSHGRFPLRQAESEMQLNGNSCAAAGLRLIPPPPDYASYMNKQQRQQLIAAGANHFLINGRLKATSEQQLNQSSITKSNDILLKPALDLVSLRQRSQDLDLPLITALFNDRSLMVPKTVPNRSRPPTKPLRTSSDLDHLNYSFNSSSNQQVSTTPSQPFVSIATPINTTPISPSITTTTTSSSSSYTHFQPMEMSCVNVSPVDLPPAQMQVLPLVLDQLQLQQSKHSPPAPSSSSAAVPSFLSGVSVMMVPDTQLNSFPSSTSFLLSPEQADRNHNTLNLNYNLPTKPPRNPTAEYIEKLWAEHFSQ